MGNFEFDGERYKQASRHQKEWGNRLIAELTLRGDESILDLGCGDGVLTAQLADLVPNGKVVGIDASIGMIRTAKALERGNLSFRHMNVDDMDYVDCFDVIYSNAALHWVKNHKRLLANSLAALKAGGILRWSFAGDGTCTYFNDEVKKVMGEEAYKGYFVHFEWPWFMPSLDEYEALASTVGFAKMDVQYEIMDRHFADSDEMTKWMDQPSLVPFLACIPENEKIGFRNKVVDAMIERTRQADGTCFERFRRIHVMGAKA